MTERLPTSEPQSVQDKEINFHQITRERVHIRRALRALKRDSASESISTAVIQKVLETLDADAKRFSIKEHGGLAESVDILREQRELYEKSDWLDEEAIGQEIGPIYQDITHSKEQLADLTDLEIASLREGTFNPIARGVNERLMPEVRKQKSEIIGRVASIKSEDLLRARAVDLVEYKRGLHQEGHIAPVPTTLEDLEQIGQRMISGKPMFLHGPTGTGKTSLARFAAEHFTGQKAEMIYCNPQTRESNIWGKQGIRPAEGEAGAHGGIETVDIYGPLARAIQEGKIIIFDEFTALPREQMVFIKGIFNARVGDTVNIMGNGIVKITPGFQMIFTANLKSDKNPERQELPPEIAREFEQNNREIGYTPPDEAYDIMLARLMDKDGSVTLSLYDLNETLPRFAKAMAEVQLAYTDKESETTARLTQTMGVGSKIPSLKKFVFTQGTVENILDAWKTEKQTNSNPSSFVKFLDQRLVTALTFKEYSEPDRILAAKILASQGLLRTVTPQELGLPSDIFNFDAGNTLRHNPEAIAELDQKSAQEKRFSILELADLDPFNKKQQMATAEAKEFDKQGDVAETHGPITNAEKIKETFGQFFKDSYKNSWNGTAEQVVKAGERPEMRRPADIVWDNTTTIEASKFGEYTLNPETVGIDWEQIPQEKIKVFEFANFRGKKRWELARYITTEWPDRDKYLIPGVEYWKYVFEHPDKAPDSLKDGNWYYFFGSIFCSSDGGWDVPGADWLDAEFGHDGDWLGNGWGSGGRVVLVEK